MKQVFMSHIKKNGVTENEIKEIKIDCGTKLKQVINNVSKIYEKIRQRIFC